MLIPHLFCSSSLASSSSSSGLRLSESAGDTAGADSAASWEEESGLSRGLPVEGGSGSRPAGEEGRSLSGLPLGVDMVAEGAEPVEELGAAVGGSLLAGELASQSTGSRELYTWKRREERVKGIDRMHGTCLSGAVKVIYIMGYYLLVW